ncbi:ComF family protein [Atopomonas sediminilitoris]|uniref:ComF family protein n=1 Tax=Atopomonas sediminilitoris TaxID=2919919 RepID=UPI001F4E80E5|nr:double zinc ribbon domain-containing protein [Atopomonas sediminilitoris]MCJ8170348.1 double zinc ribbon domain-containing protein [Atopomonas sediminilitoris]
MDCQPNIIKQVYKWLLFDQTCWLCEEPSHGDLPLCHGCEDDLPWLLSHCPCCAEPLASAQLCRHCQQRRPHFATVISPLRYAFPVDSLLQRFKADQQTHYGRLLSHLLARHLQHAYAEGLARPDLLLPVPQANTRLRQRGFNQAQWLCRWLSATLELPWQRRWLHDNGQHQSQKKLSARARARNLRAAFSLTEHAKPGGLHIALVDDIVTTGSTANALAALLLSAGAAQVDVYCVARTAKIP